MMASTKGPTRVEATKRTGVTRVLVGAQVLYCTSGTCEHLPCTTERPCTIESIRHTHERCRPSAKQRRVHQRAIPQHRATRSLWQPTSLAFLPRTATIARSLSRQGRGWMSLQPITQTRRSSRASSPRAGAPPGWLSFAALSPPARSLHHTHPASWACSPRAGHRVIGQCAQPRT